MVSLSVVSEKRLSLVVAPLSTGSTPRLPLVVAVPSAGAGSNARIDQIRKVAKSRILNVAGSLNRADMAQVEQGLRTVLGLETHRN